MDFYNAFSSTNNIVDNYTVGYHCLFRQQRSAYRIIILGTRFGLGSNPGIDAQFV